MLRGLSWDLLLLFVFLSPETVTFENINLKEAFLHLRFEFSRSHVGFQTVSVAVILPDNILFCVV